MSSDSRASASHARGGRIFLWLVGGLSLLGYFALACQRGWSRPGDVATYLILMTGLFGLYLLLVRRILEDRASRALGAGSILAWAVLFRLLSIPAGLGEWPGFWSDSPSRVTSTAGPELRWQVAPSIESRADDLAADLRGEVPYASHLLYDNDVWRYFWDGHQVLAGTNPYRYSPDEVERIADGDLVAVDAEVAALLDEDPWPEVHDRVSYRSYRTVYPPLALGTFALGQWLRPASVVAWKLLLIALDLAVCLLLLSTLRHLGRPESWLVVYAWCPLVVKEIAGSGHVDVLVVFFMSVAAWFAARQWPAAASLAVVGAVLTKLAPILVLPPFLLRSNPRKWIWPGAALVLGGWPIWQSWPWFSDSVGAFARDWVFNPGVWLAVETVSHGLGFEGRAAADSFGRWIVLLGVAVACGAVLLLDRDRLDTPQARFDRGVLAAASILGLYLFVSSTVMPWYLVWPLPLLALAGRTPLLWPWLSLCLLSQLSYCIYVDGIERAWWAWPQVVVPLALLAWELRRGRKLRSDQGA